MSGKTHRGLRAWPGIPWIAAALAGLFGADAMAFVFLIFFVFPTYAVWGGVAAIYAHDSSEDKTAFLLNASLMAAHVVFLLLLYTDAIHFHT